MTSPARIAADRLKSFIERIERLREEKAAISADERDVFSEAKGVGYDTKAMRKVLQRRAMDPSALDEMDALIETYESALGGKGVAAEALRGGSTIREAAEAGGISVGAAAALARVQKTEILERPAPVQKTREVEQSESDVSRSAAPILAEGTVEGKREASGTQPRAPEPTGAAQPEPADRPLEPEGSTHGGDGGLATQDSAPTGTATAGEEEIDGGAEGSPQCTGAGVDAVYPAKPAKPDEARRSGAAGNRIAGVEPGPSITIHRSVIASGALGQSLAVPGAVMSDDGLIPRGLDRRAGRA